jgi:ribonuclease HII
MPWLPASAQPPPASSPRAERPPAGIDPRGTAGVDEAGRGPWAGPVVAAAVILPTPLRHVRIDDSKRLSRLQRERAFEAILQRARVGVGIVCAEEIDRRNILQATLAAMAQAVGQLRPAPGLVLVDGALAPPLSMACRPIIGGDGRYGVIACASIVAKVVRDRLMAFYHELFPSYAFIRHKGYGTSLHAERLAALGPSLLHRHSFKPVQAALIVSRDAGPPDADLIPQPAGAGAQERAPGDSPVALEGVWH